MSSGQWNKYGFETWLGHDNTIFDLIRTKQCCYYLNPSHESIFFRIYAGFTVILMSASIAFLISREGTRFNRLVLHVLCPMP